MKSIFNTSYISKLILPEPLNNYANKIIVTEVYKLYSSLIYEVNLPHKNCNLYCFECIHIIILKLIAYSNYRTNLGKT